MHVSFNDANLNNEPVIPFDSLSIESESDCCLVFSDCESEPGFEFDNSGVNCELEVSFNFSDDDESVSFNFGCEDKDGFFLILCEHNFKFVEENLLSSLVFTMPVDNISTEFIIKSNNGDLKAEFKLDSVFVNCDFNVLVDFSL